MNMYRALAFDVDPVSSGLLRQALPGWRIESMFGQTAETLQGDWNPGGVNLLVVGVRDDFTETLALCRFLAYCTYYSSSFPREPGRRQTESERLRGVHPPVDAPVLALIPGGKEMFAKALNEAGVHASLLLPLNLSDLVEALDGLQAGEQDVRRHRLSSRSPEAFT